VAKNLPGRIGKQCRERWHNHLDSNINKHKWTIEEDMLIVKLHLLHGNRWCDIAKQVDGRTDNAIKNRFNSNLSKRLNEPTFAKLLKVGVDCRVAVHEDSVTLEKKVGGSEVEDLSQDMQANSLVSSLLSTVSNSQRFETLAKSIVQ